MRKIVYDLVHKQEETHWWYRIRRKIVFDLIKKFFVTDSNKTILDIGCGTGFLLKEFQNFERVYGIDCAQEALDYCRKRGLENVKKGNISDVPFNDNQFDIVLALDVLEHVENDDKALREMNRVLKRGGIGIIFVPAFQSLWGISDELGLHIRRYRRGALADKIQRENFRILKASYFNMFLFLPAALFRKLFLCFSVSVFNF